MCWGWYWRCRAAVAVHDAEQSRGEHRVSRAPAPPCRRGSGSAVLSQESPSLSRLAEPGWPCSRTGDVGSCLGPESICSSPRQSCVQRIHSRMRRLSLSTRSPKRGAKRCIYIHCQSRERKMYRILVLTYMKNLENAIITVLCTVWPEDVTMAICTSSGKPVIISTWPEEKLLTK